MIDKSDWWDPTMNEEDIDHILSQELFAQMDKDKFPARNPLVDIICKHTRLVPVKKRALVVRAGDYGNSAFLIISGQVNVIFAPGLSDDLLGRSPDKTLGWGEAISKLWKNAKYPEVRNASKEVNADQPGHDYPKGVFIQDIPVVLKSHANEAMGPGMLFGEVAALGRTPRGASIIASSDDCILVEIRWQGLSFLRKFNNEFRNSIDKLYRKNSLLSHLHSLPLFEHLSDSELQIVADNTLFESYGTFEWHQDYKEKVEADSSELLSNEPIIVAEGDYADGLLLMRSGFARMSSRYNNGHRILKYLGRGDQHGLRTIIHNWQHQDTMPLMTSLHAVGYTDVLRVPSKVIEEYVLKNMSEAELAKYAFSVDELGQLTHPDAVDENPLDFDDGVLDFMSDFQYINGTATMLIDLDRCVRCDECVTACAVGHNNNPRFNRHGRIYDHFMVANACMHCSDPVCMIGCPTGAIHRKPLEGEIVINDDTCIGCATCANSCPYDNIRMVEVRNDEGQIKPFDSVTNQKVKATKCDLCFDQIGGPACERACPHDALTRKKVLDLPKLVDWMNR